MTNTLNHPVPIGELLEKLRAEGFAVAPAQYGRVFTVVEAVFPEGINPESNTTDFQTLKELLGPIVCRTFAEQERFGDLFDSVMARPMVDYEDSENPDTPEPVRPVPESGWLRKLLIGFGLLVAFVVGYIAWLIYSPQPDPDPVRTTWPSAPSCVVDFGVQSIQGDSVTFVNRSPDLSGRSGRAYLWDFGDGTPRITSRQQLVGHRFRIGTKQATLSRTTLSAVGCNNEPVPLPKVNTYNPSPLPFLRLPGMSRYTLANWVPLLLIGLGGLLGGGWWLTRRRRQQKQSAQRPTGGPFFLSFPPQDDAIQPSPSLVSWAHQLQQREESERHMLAIGPTIRRTIRNGGMPSVQYEAIKRRPRYLILIDDRSAYDQQAKLYAYVMGVLITRSVEMDVFFFHSDPRYLWNENYPKGLPISDLFRLYSSHYLVLVTEGTRLLDYDTGEVAGWAVEALSGWTSRALLTPVYPANWHYLEAALSRFFILLPATPDGQFLLRDYLGQPDNAPSFADLLRQFKVMPGTPSRGIFSLNTAKITVDEVRNFLLQSVQGSDQTESVRQWLFTWACATAVFPTPDWAMTLAIGRALETHFNVEGLVTSTNILKLTALPWLRQDSIPEPLRANLLAQLPADQETVARQTVVAMLHDLRLSSGSVAHEEQQLRIWEQEYHLKNKHLGELSTYRQYSDLIKDQGIQQRLARQDKVENQYQPAGLLVLLLLPLLLYLTPPQTQVAGVLMPFFKTDSTAADSAAFYNNRAVDSFETKHDNSAPFESFETKSEEYKQGVSDLVRSINYRKTFETIYNLNVSRYNQAVYENRSKPLYRQIGGLLSGGREANILIAPLQLFDTGWVPDSAATRRYLVLLADKANNDDLYYFANIENQASINSGRNEGVEISNPISFTEFKRLADRAKIMFRAPGRLEIAQNRRFLGANRLNDSLLTFQPTTPQRDSLISLEAARIVLYFGGPQRSKTVPLEASNNIASQTTEEIASGKPSASGSTGGGWDEPAKKPRPSSQTVAKPRINARATAAQDEVTRLRYRQLSRTIDTVSVRQQPGSTTTVSQTATNAVSTPPASRTVAQATPPATVGNDYTPSNQQVQQQQVQQQVQQQAPIDESTLQKVYEQGTKCPPNNSYSISLPKGDKRPIQAGILTQLSDSPNLYELVFYCDSYPQTIYSKRGFSHVKMEKDAKGGSIRLVFYQNRQRVYKK